MKPRTNESPLRSRLSELDRQLGEVGSEIESLTKALQRKGEPLAAPRRPRPGRTGGGRRAGREARGGGGARGGRDGEDGLQAVHPAQWKDRRFASYFMSGNLGPSAPQLRRERRLQRNRAIVMIVVVAVVLIGILKFAMAW